MVALSERTLRDKRALLPCPDEQPTFAVTMGTGTILEARHILLQAIDEAKAPAVQGMVEGPVTGFLPASALQLHPRVEVILDPGAARRLALRAEYRARLECREALRERS